MSLHPQAIGAVPEETARVARLALSKENLCVCLRAQIGPLYEDTLFAALFPHRGRPAEAPWRLALVCVLQYVEGLSDRQAAETVRTRLDWKYLLGLKLTDPGFDFSVLSEFRARLVAGQAIGLLLDRLLECCKHHGWLKERGQQRTDSTHILSCARALNRLEVVGETLRHALNVVAEVAPTWLRDQITPEWFDRYSRRVEEYRLPKGVAARKAHAELIGADGRQLLQAVEAETAPHGVRDLPALELLRQVWDQQYLWREGRLCWRDASELGRAGVRMDTPYDPEAHFGNKRSVTWTGYQVHLTETCEEDLPHLITAVQTTAPDVADVALTEPIQEELAEKGLLPSLQLVDSGYVDADLLVHSQHARGVTVVGPVRPNSSWQARKAAGYEQSQFTIDWQQQRVVCPQGKVSRCWVPHQDAWGNSVVSVSFSRTDCRLCPVRTQCTRAKSGDPRRLVLRPQAQNAALERMRQEARTADWQQLYQRRAGIEGTHSQALRVCDLRHARYRGIQKTHLQHVLTATALNCLRLNAWLNGRKLAKTRTSHFARLALAG